MCTLCDSCTQPLFTQKFFYKLFFHAHHHYISLYNLNPLSLTPFVCLCSITLNSPYDIVCHVNIILIFTFMTYIHLFANKMKAYNRAWYIQPHDGLNSKDM